MREPRLEIAIWLWNNPGEHTLEDTIDGIEQMLKARGVKNSINRWEWRKEIISMIVDGIIEQVKGEVIRATPETERYLTKR